MTDRATKIDAALAAAGLAGWDRAPLAGDASRRRYLRLTRAGDSRILMDAPPDSGEEVAPFLAIGAHLRSLGLCAPQVHHADPARGLLVLEDLGPDHFAAWLERHPGDEMRLYSAAIDALAVIQSAAPPPGLATLDPDTGAAMIAPALDHVLPPDPALHADLTAALRQTLADTTTAPVLSLRDFHAENLVWRPERTGTDRVGLLDFQDAFLADPAYDLASLLRDARRDVAPKAVSAMLDRAASAGGRDRAALGAAFAALSVQRNLRILGIFARLIHRDGKPRYAAFVPRVRAHIDTDLAHPALSALAPLVRRALA